LPILDLFEEGSVTNLLTSIVGNVFGFKGIASFASGDCGSLAYLKTFQGPPHGIQVEQDSTSTVVPSWAARSNPNWVCRLRTMVVLFMCLRAVLTSPKMTNQLSAPSCWRDRFLFVAEAIKKAQAETGEIRVTTSTVPLVPAKK